MRKFIRVSYCIRLLRLPYSDAVKDLSRDHRVVCKRFTRSCVQMCL